MWDHQNRLERLLELKVEAICFNCGAGKQMPLKVCGACHTAPEERNDKIASLAMSTDCIRPEQLKVCAKQIKRKKRPPKFGAKILAKATDLLENNFDVSQDDDDSFELSSSMFDMSSLADKDEERFQMGTRITTYVVGRRKSWGDDTPPSMGTNLKTYHATEWVVGQDISKVDAEQNVDESGCLYVLYRWLETRWIRKFISQMSYLQFKAMEDGQGKF